MASKKSTPSSKITEQVPQPATGDAGAATDTSSVDREPATADDRQAQIRRAAYANYEQRGDAPGSEAEDWLHAEGEWERNRKG